MTPIVLMLVTLVILLAGALLALFWLAVQPALIVQLLVRVSRGQWLLRWLQLPGIKALSSDRLLATWVWDFDRREITLTGRGMAHLGYGRDQVVEPAENLMQIIHPDDQLRLNRIVRHFVRDQPEFTIECRLHRRLGRKPWVRINGVSLLRATDGRLRLACGSFEDISERKVHVGTIAAMNEQLQLRLSQQQEQLLHAEKARQDLTARLRQMLDTVPVSICWKDVHGRYLGCNTQFARIARLPSPEAIVGKSDYDFYWSAQVPEILQEEENVIASGEPLIDHEMQFQPQAQGLRQLRCCLVPLRDADGECIGVLKTYQDVTRSYLLARASDKEQQLLQDVLDSTDAMISIVDREHCFVRVNRLLENVVGIDRADFLGKKVEEVFGGKLGKRATDIVDHILATQQPVKAPYELRDQLGKVRHFFAHSNPLFDEQGQVDKIITVSMEITQLKLAQEAVEEAREKAETALEVKGRFLANMSHEIRTPMNAIIGLSQLALSTELNSRTEDYVQKIHYSAENLLGIVNDILDFSKIEAGKLTLLSKPFDLLQMLENLGSIMALKANRKRLQFEQEVEPNTPRYISGDALRLHQVLTNLIGNAVKFTREGFVRLSVRMSVDMGERQILRFKVEDSGVGLNEQQLGQLFQAFEQADAGVAREYGGTGLGLSISQRLVEMMGGEIKVTSRQGVGSVFEFTVNVGIADAEAANQQQKKTGGEIPDLQGAKVLLVEDNDINQQVALEMLAPLNVQVDTAGNGAEALAQVASNDYQLVLMDIQMPVMDGYTATQKLREQYPASRLPIVGLTANVLEEDRKRMNQVGMNDHIGKPIDRRSLEQTLAKWILPTRLFQAQDEKDAMANNKEDVKTPDINQQEGLARVRGRVDRYVTLLESFFSQYASAPEQMKALQAKNDWLAIAQLAHAIKGVAGNLAVTRVYDLCGQLQSLAEQEQAEAIADTVDALAQAMPQAEQAFALMRAEAGG